MITFDLHYHTNVFRCSPYARKKRLLAHKHAVGINQVDFLASTEHGYKRPLDAYLYLRDALQGLNTVVIPGVEAVSVEGADFIFLFRTEEDLKRGIRSTQPFEWTVWDSGKLAEDLGAISILPHPFTPGRSGIVTQAGVDGLSRLLKQSDYVEAHNGSSFMLSKAVNSKRKRARSLIASRHDFERKVKFTHDLPKRFRPKDVGVVFSSDAHFPGQQFMFSAADMKYSKTFDWFDFLRQRVRFERVEANLYDDFMKNGSSNSYTGLTRTMVCVLGEAIEKKVKRHEMDRKRFFFGRCELTLEFPSLQH